jgi:hypothetical protein
LYKEGTVDGPWKNGRDVNSEGLDRTEKWILGEREKWVDSGTCRVIQLPSGAANLSQKQKSEFVSGEGVEISAFSGWHFSS